MSLPLLRTMWCGPDFSAAGALAEMLTATPDVALEITPARTPAEFTQHLVRNRWDLLLADVNEWSAAWEEALAQWAQTESPPPLLLLNHTVVGSVHSTDQETQAITVVNWRHLDAHWLGYTIRQLLEKHQLIQAVQQTQARMAFFESQAHPSDAHRARESMHDHLTSLPNRRLFINRVGRSIDQARRHTKAHFAVMSLDIDRFKVINEGLGSNVGDLVIIEVSQRLQNCVRPGDMVARLGEDEFGILLDNTHDSSDALRVCRRVQEALQKPIRHEGRQILATLSTGIALSHTGYQRPEDMIRDAQTAMQRARTEGGARHRLFDAAMQSKAVERLQIELEMNQAVTERQFFIMYQPIINIASGQLIGLEALIRWQHPQRGLIGPADFIPIAEETGLIRPMGVFALRQACEHLKQWRSLIGERELSVSVNLSAKVLAQTGLVEEVKRVLLDTQIPSSSLKLELTESAIMHNPETAVEVMQQLKDLDVQLHIDDFGTGYSSLSYLHRFPIDTLKIDRSFIADITSGHDGGRIVKTILSLAKDLRMKVTAEGVERQDQLDQLVEWECDQAQGYLFSRPVEPEQIAKMLREQRVWSPLQAV